MFLFFVCCQMNRCNCWFKFIFLTVIINNENINRNIIFFKFWYRFNFHRQINTIKIQIISMFKIMSNSLRMIVELNGENCWQHRPDETVIIVVFYINDSFLFLDKDSSIYDLALKGLYLFIWMDKLFIPDLV